ncbi:hypothetical protein L7F22_013202 [Adiantum nelumboides]|nr:hypothetical protein [Adiantum nelumboides]
MSVCRKFVLSQHPKKLLPFMKFVFSQEDLSNACKPEWIKIYDTEYVDSLIRRVCAWTVEADELSRRLEEKISVIKQQEKHFTTFKAFNLSTAQKKPTITDENKAPLAPPPFKAKPPPEWKGGPTPTQKALEAVCKESREKLAMFYSSPKNQPFHLHILERPSKFSALKEQCPYNRWAGNEVVDEVIVAIDDSNSAEVVVALGRGEPMEDFIRGKKSPLHELVLTKAPQSLNPTVEQTSRFNELPSAELPQGWKLLHVITTEPISRSNELPCAELLQGSLQEAFVNFNLDQTPAHDVSILHKTASSSPTKTTALTLPDSVKEVNLGDSDKPRPILLAAWLWDHPMLLDQIEAERKMETEYIPPKARPCPEPPRDAVKLTTSAVLREHALYQKQLDEERERLNAFEVDLRDDSDYKCWQEEMRSRDKILECAHRRFTKAAVDACDQAAADARNAKVEKNREMVKQVKEESQKLEALNEEFLVNLDLFNRLRRENILEGQNAVKSALIKVAKLKRERAREIQAETTKLVSICASERANELAKRKELIQQLHTLERESAQIMKKFDRDSTAGHGLLGEMSIAELQERLAVVKEAIKKEEEHRRVRISASKEEKNAKTAEKSAFVQKMRQLAHVRRLARKDENILPHNPGNELTEDIKGHPL